MIAGIGFIAIGLSWGLCLLLAVAMTYWLSRTRGMLNAVDIPNERSLHSTPIPRSGGLAVTIATGFLWTWLLFQFEVPAFMPWLLGSVLLVLGISWIDDHHQLPAPLRMLVHMAAAALLVIGGLGLERLTALGFSWQLPAGFAVVFTLLFVVWMTNLFNFMDGMDGFAGGMATIGFGCMALLGWTQQHPLFALLSSYVALASCGFLVFNFPPARIFLGDVGSCTLGVLAAVFALWAERESIFPLWVAILIFSPFIVDATVTMLRRLWRGENVLKAHRKHYYQRVVQWGWGHRKTVLCEYVLMLICAAAALISHNAPLAVQALAIGFVVVLELGAMAAIHHVAPRTPLGVAKARIPD